MFGTLLAGVIALLLIAIVLAIVSKIGQLRLADISAQQTAVILPKSHSSREALGLQAPAPIPEPVVRPEIPEGIQQNIPAPLVPAAAVPQEELPPALRLPTGDAALPPASEAAPASRPPAPIWQKVAGLPYDRIYTAFLWRPTTATSPAPVEPPRVTQDFAQLRNASRLNPDAARQLIEERRPMQTLAQLRAQATMPRNPSATTQPSS